MIIQFASLTSANELGVSQQFSNDSPPAELRARSNFEST